MDAASPPNGNEPPSIIERVESLETRVLDAERNSSSLRKDLERTYRVILEIQVEMRNQHRAVMDRLEKLRRG